ncbi:MAG: four helix bundle protein [Ferruginibacter sp.]|nr:four helix bundle protein [Ferruginibacter sp.]MBP8764511.1 four helix bundle protein [Ferruginibacter sp.]MBP9605409.1 four helix bundle protein [Ferruginibacter sp.]
MPRRRNIRPRITNEEVNHYYCIKCSKGTSRKTYKVHSYFSTISYSSAIELLNNLIIAKDLGYLSNEQYIEVREQVEIQTFLIARLRKSQQSIIKQNPKQT